MRLRKLFIPLQWIWRTLFFINFALTFFLLYPFFSLFLSSRRWFPLVFNLKWIWAHLLTWPLGIFYSIERRSQLKKGQAYVICPNHTSYLDVILTYVAVPKYFHMMGKAELLKIPLFSRFFKRMNIPVNRKSRMDSHRAFVRASQDIDKGISINLFPEGTISKQSPVMLRFKNGPFKLAIDKQIPIVPITYMNNWSILPEYYHMEGGGHPGVSRIIVHEPIPTAGMTDDDLEALKDRVFEMISEPLKKRYPERFKAHRET